MPSYDYFCQRCDTVIELTHTMKDCDVIHRCEKCGYGMERRASQLNVKPCVDADWHLRNGGKGMGCTQFFNPNLPPGHPDAIRYFRSQNDLIETAKREGYKVQRTR